MTELEQQLTNALTALSKQYEAQMEQQAEWVGELQEQVQRLEESVKDLKPQLGRTEALAEDLKQQVELLRRDYREIAEVLRVVWTRSGSSSRPGNGSAGRSETMAPAANINDLRGRRVTGRALNAEDQVMVSGIVGQP